MIDESKVFQGKSGLWAREGTLDSYVINEQSTYNALPVVPEESIVLDVGAHIGAFARYILARGAKGVYSFEPEPDNFAMLTRNAEGFPIQAYAGAIVAGDEQTIELWLNGGKNTGNHSLLQRRGRDAVTVNAYNFGEALETFRPSVIKIDIEGGEYALEETLGSLPSFVKAIAMELHYIKPEHHPQAERIANRLALQFGEPLKPPHFGEKLWHTVGVWAR